ncbi:MAG: hypothetical protein K5894_07015 [Lachnospiraceae bacterium]|nr:hypothetical protein [Lachnospiraceae bacterium]
MENNTNKKKSGQASKLTNLILACILVVALATAAFVIKSEISKVRTDTAATAESSEIAVKDEDSSEDAGSSENDEEKKESESSEDSEKEESEASDESKEEDKSEDKEDSEAKDEEEEEETLSLEEFTEHNSALPFAHGEKDDLIVAFDTDDTLLVPSSDEEIEGCIEAINHLEDDGYNWCIVSANADDNKPARIQEWILDMIDSTDHYLGFYVVNPGRDRILWCNENNVDVLVDDNKDTAALADEYMFDIFLVDGSGVEETRYLHPMKGSSPYNGFKSFLRSVKLYKGL